MNHILNKKSLQQIFLKLPIGSLMHCRKVCRLWRELICGHNFTRVYTLQSLVAKKGVMVYSSQQNPVPCSKLLFIDRRHGPIPTCIPLRLPFKNYRVIGSCNGLLCLACYTGKLTMVVCNPLLGELIETPHHYVHTSSKEYTSFSYEHWGFGFCFKTQSYKILKVLQRRAQTEENEWKCWFEAYVHRVGDSNWKCIDIQAYDMWSQWTCSPASLVSGALHWVTWNSADNLFVFDLEDDVFKYMEGPNAVAPTGNRLTTGVIAKCLAIMNTSRFQVDIWLMKQYGDTGSWMRYFIIYAPQIHFILDTVRVLDYQEEDGLFLSYDFEFGNYSMVHMIFQRVGIVGYNRGLLSGDHSLQVITHCDTLISPRHLQ